jgi:hypothetical protein
MNMTFRKCLSLILFLTLTFSPLCGKIEEVRVIKVDGYEVLIKRKNDDIYLLEVGIGCLGLSLREGRKVLISSSSFFAGLGSYLIIPDREQECRIWKSEQIE